MNAKGASRRSDGSSNSNGLVQDLHLLSIIQDEVHDAQRVQRQGQEEDLNYALGRMITRVEELSTLLTQAYKVQAEMETSLKLARSNLQLALANNEMLEDALKREGVGGGKDVGWRRISEREAARRVEDGTNDKNRKESLDTPTSPVPSASTPSTTPYLSVSPTLKGSVSAPTSPAHSVATAVSPTPSHDSRFFRFRFGSSSTSRATSPPLAKRENVSHLASASSPALVISSPSRREVELEADLESERARHKVVYAEKLALESEVENLSQALFEEANKMVSQERIKSANFEEELRQATEEKLALKSALRLLEMENFRLRGLDDDSTEEKTNTSEYSAAMDSTEFTSESHVSPTYSPIVSDTESPRSSNEIKSVSNTQFWTQRDSFTYPDADVTPHSPGLNSELGKSPWLDA